MATNINEKLFDESTLLKLKIFGESFREWLPVFIHNQQIRQIHIYDFFAGSGTDIEGNPGSPLILLSEAKGENGVYCKNTDKKVSFIFNESIKKKSKELKKSIDNYIVKCQKQNQCDKCNYEYQIRDSDFKSIFPDNAIQNILTNNNYGKFILLDQYGFKEIDDEIFKQLIGFPKTDFIFFISSSFIKRFKEHPNTKAYINTERINFDESQPKDCHRIIADYFKRLIPKTKEYYLHHFSIQKETNKGNYYGLIFGTNHPLGIEKFLKVCWENDKFSGESNFNIDNDHEKGSLFYDHSNSNKKNDVKELIENQILSGKITDNISGLKFAMQHGCKPILFTDVVKKLEKEDKIERLGDLNFSSTNIHKVKEYFIKVLKK